MLNRKRTLVGALVTGVVVLLVSWAAMEEPEAQPQQSIFDLQRRIEALEGQNQQDYNAIQNLYQRVQQMESRLSQVEQRVTSLQQQGVGTGQPSGAVATPSREEKKRASSGYPRVKQVRRDQNGNLIIQYDK